MSVCVCFFKSTGMVVPVLNHDGTTASFSEVLWGHDPADLHIPPWYGRPCCLSYIYPFRVSLYHLLSALHATPPRFLLGPCGDDLDNRDPPCVSAYTDRHNKLSKLMHWLAVAAALSQLEHSNQFCNSDIAPRVRPSPASPWLQNLHIDGNGGRSSFYICWAALSTVMILNDTHSLLMLLILVDFH